MGFVDFIYLFFVKGLEKPALCVHLTKTFVFLIISFSPLSWRVFSSYPLLLFPTRQVSQENIGHWVSCHSCVPSTILPSWSHPPFRPLSCLRDYHRSVTVLSSCLGFLLSWPSMLTVSISLNVVAAALDWQLPTSSFPWFVFFSSGRVLYFIFLTLILFSFLFFIPKLCMN